MNDKEGRKWLLQKLYDNGIKYIAYSPFYGGYVGVKETPIISGKGEVVNDTKQLSLCMDFYQILMSRIISILASIWVLLIGVKFQLIRPYLLKRHFAKFENGRVCFFGGGRTSWSSENNSITYIAPKYVKLAGGDDES